MDKFQEAFKAINVPVAPATVDAEVAKILENAQQYACEDVYKFLFNSIDLTTLSTTDTVKSVAKFTERVNDFDNDYPQLPNVAAICVYSNFAEVVSTHLEVPQVDIAVVAGCFPSSQTFLPVKIADSALAVSGGADEVDIVFNLGYFFDENYEDLTDEISEIKHNIKDAKLKVILETGALKSYENIYKASVLSLYSEADFLKTSTGKIYEGATPAAAWVMCKCIKEYYEKTGRKVGFKASGGVRSTADALQYYAIVKEVLGDEWLCHDLFRIGASSLANSLLSSILGEEVKYF